MSSHRTTPTDRIQTARGYHHAAAGTLNAVATLHQAAWEYRTQEERTYTWLARPRETNTACVVELEAGAAAAATFAAALSRLKALVANNPPCEPDPFVASAPVELIGLDSTSGHALALYAGDICAGAVYAAYERPRAFRHPRNRDDETAGVLPSRGWVYETPDSFLASRWHAVPAMDRSAHVARRLFVNQRDCSQKFHALSAASAFLDRTALLIRMEVARVYGPNITETWTTAQVPLLTGPPTLGRLIECAEYVGRSSPSGSRAAQPNRSVSTRTFVEAVAEVFGADFVDDPAYPRLDAYINCQFGRVSLDTVYRLRGAVCAALNVDTLAADRLTVAEVTNVLKCPGTAQKNKGGRPVIDPAGDAAVAAGWEKGNFHTIASFASHLDKSEKVVSDALERNRKAKLRKFPKV